MQPQMVPRPELAAPGLAEWSTACTGSVMSVQAGISMPVPPEPTAPVLVARPPASDTGPGINEKQHPSSAAVPTPDADLPVQWMEHLPQEVWVRILAELAKQAPRDAHADLAFFARCSKATSEAVRLCREYVRDPRLDLLDSRAEFAIATGRATSSLALWRREDIFREELKKRLASHCAMHIDARHLGRYFSIAAIQTCMEMDSTDYLHLCMRGDLHPDDDFTALHNAALARLKEGRALPTLFIGYECLCLELFPEMLDSSSFAPSVAGISLTKLSDRCFERLDSRWATMLRRLSALRYLHVHSHCAIGLPRVLRGHASQPPGNLEELHLINCEFDTPELITFLRRLSRALPKLARLSLDGMKLKQPRLTELEQAISRSLRESPRLTISVGASFPIRNELKQWAASGRILVGKLPDIVFTLPEIYSEAALI